MVLFDNDEQAVIQNDKVFITNRRDSFQSYTSLLENY